MKWWKIEKMNGMERQSQKRKKKGKRQRNNDLIQAEYDIDPIAKRLECLLSDVNVQYNVARSANHATVCTMH